MRLDAYPEGGNLMAQWRTPCHAAALVGKSGKLKILLSDINSRYSKGLKPNETRNYKKDNIKCLFFENRWQTLLRQKKYRVLNKFNTTVFEKKL